MTTTTINVDFEVEEKALIEACAAELGVSTSEFVRIAVLERIEDELAARCQLDEEPGPFETIARKYL